MADNSGMTYPLGSLRGTASGSSAAAQTRSSLPRPVSRWRLQLAITLGGTLLVLWMLAMFSHHPGDAAFSTSGDGRPLRNQAGVIGAWLSDLSFVLCGLSAWWLLLFGLRGWLSAVARLLRVDLAPVETIDGPVHWRPWWQAWVGLLLLLLSSTSLEWTRLYQHEGLVAGTHAGGVLGAMLGPLSMKLLASSAAACCGSCCCCCRWPGPSGSPGWVWPSASARCSTSGASAATSVWPRPRTSASASRRSASAACPDRRLPMT